MSKSVLPLFIVVILLTSCGELIQTVESADFCVEVKKVLDSIQIFVRGKEPDGQSRKILSSERDKGVDARLLDKSTLLVTDIRARGDGTPALLTNLWNDSTPTLFFSVDRAMIEHDSLELTVVKVAGLEVTTARKVSRDDVLFIKINAPGRNVPPEAIILLGAERVAIDSVTSESVTFTCTWQGSHASQVFRVNVSDLVFEPEDFSLVP